MESVGNAQFHLKGHDDISYGFLSKQSVGWTCLIGYCMQAAALLFHFCCFQTQLCYCSPG